MKSMLKALSMSLIMTAILSAIISVQASASDYAVEPDTRYLVRKVVAFRPGISSWIDVWTNDGSLWNIKGGYGRERTVTAVAKGPEFTNVKELAGGAGSFIVVRYDGSVTLYVDISAVDEYKNSDKYYDEYYSLMPNYKGARDTGVRDFWYSYTLFEAGSGVNAIITLGNSGDGAEYYVLKNTGDVEVWRLADELKFYKIDRKWTNIKEIVNNGFSVREKDYVYDLTGKRRTGYWGTDPDFMSYTRYFMDAGQYTQVLKNDGSIESTWTDTEQNSLVDNVISTSICENGVTHMENLSIELHEDGTVWLDHGREKVSDLQNIVKICSSGTNVYAIDTEGVVWGFSVYNISLNDKPLDQYDIPERVNFFMKNGASYGIVFAIGESGQVYELPSGDPIKTEDDRYLNINETYWSSITTDPLANTLSSIKVTTPPNKTVYKAGERFDPSGMVVTATYGDNSKKIVTDYTIYPPVLTAETESVIVSYRDGETASSFTLDVYVVDANQPQPQVQESQKNPFKDVKESDLFCDAVLWAYYAEPQVTTGISATKFNPTGIVTRAQCVTFLWRAMGCPEPAISVNPFMDVSSHQYYYKAVLWAVEKGITMGTDATHFNPNGTLTTAHIATFLYRTLGIGTDGWYQDAAAWAKNENLLSGLNTTIAPNVDCPRSSVVLFLYRELGKRQL